MILIKQHNSHQVAHMYEHLFCMAIDDFFYDHGLSPHLDYNTFAHTLSKGIIYISVTARTPGAEALTGELSKISVQLDDRSLHTASIQLMAEKEQFLGIAGETTPDFDAVRKELREINEKPWQDIEDLDLINPQDIQLKPGSIYELQEKKGMPARKVKVTFSLDRRFADAHKELLPLFWQLAMLMSEDVMADLYSQGGFYSKKITHQPKHKATRLIHLFHIVPHFPLEIPRLLETVSQALLALHHEGVYRRLTSSLHAADKDKGRTPPDPLYMFERTGVLIGMKGWQRIATHENCNLVLSHMTVRVNAGRDGASAKIKSILEL